jgi:2Fe-2S ferredoxin
MSKLIRRRGRMRRRGEFMPTVTFIDPDGTPHSLEGEEGMSLMELAVHNGLEGIEADCGGACACATCHVYVDEAWTALTGEAAGDEADMLEFAVDPQAGSRLACQIRLTAALDGLVVRIPLSQH